MEDFNEAETDMPEVQEQDALPAVEEPSEQA